jgi:hypothetical protein
MYIPGTLQKNRSWDRMSEDENDYLERCPIYHDVDTQNIYGFEVTSQPLRESEEYLWKDCKFPPICRIQVSS